MGYRKITNNCNKVITIEELMEGVSLMGFKVNKKTKKLISLVLKGYNYISFHHSSSGLNPEFYQITIVNDDNELKVNLYK